MQLTQEINRLKRKIAEAEELSVHHKREMEKNPDNFLFQLRYDGFRGFIEQLEEELAEYEKEMQEQSACNRLFQPLLWKPEEIAKHLNNTAEQLREILTITKDDYISNQNILIFSMQKELEQDKNSQTPSLVLTELDRLNDISRTDLRDFDKIANSLSLVHI
ncbi:MAG: hypothetical protein FD167_5688 [bacterium]|nr:MAG: hypothetical protein FD167_5688 [bacterium]